MENQEIIAKATKLAKDILAAAGQEGADRGEAELGWTEYQLMELDEAACDAFFDGLMSRENHKEIEALTCVGVRVKDPAAAKKLNADHRVHVERAEQWLAEHA